MRRRHKWLGSYHSTCRPIPVKYLIIKFGLFPEVLTRLGLSGQNFVVRSMRVRGMVKMHSKRSEIARLAIKMFLVVSSVYQ